MSRADALVDTEWVEGHLDDPSVVLVEVDEDTSAYDKGHIRNAIKLDWKRDLQDPVRRDFVDKASFEELLSERGIHNDDMVVLYGGNNNWFAAYAYWYFKLYGHRKLKLLDGGRTKWELESRELVTVSPARPKTSYQATEQDSSLRAMRDEVLAAIGERNLVDVRAPDEFSGTALAPAHLPQETAQRAGHIPTAKNVPWSKAANEDGTFKSDEELRALYADDAGLDFTKGTITYSRIGERSAHTWFVLHALLEQPDVKNYDGSWTEYGSLVGVPVETGEAGKPLSVRSDTELARDDLSQADRIGPTPSDSGSPPANDAAIPFEARDRGGAGIGDESGSDSEGIAREPRPRFLTGLLPERAPKGARIPLLVQVTLSAVEGVSAPLKRFPVSPAGTVVTITVFAPGLIPLGDLEKELTVPFSKDSDPARFGFRTGPLGQHLVQIQAFAGGTCLGELTLKISVETEVTIKEGRPQKAPLADLTAEPGEVTLQVGRTAGGGYNFQLLSEALPRAEIIDRLARDPDEVINNMIAELRAMSTSTKQYVTPALARQRLRSLGSQLWSDIVPKSIREQFWAQRDNIRLFTIASDMDTVPWELLYPVDLVNDHGFLVDQFPVVRRVHGQVRTRVLQLDRGVGYVVPLEPKANVLEEVAAVRATFPANVGDRGTETGLAAVLQLLDPDADAVPSVLHFAGHNTFTEAGSLISLDGGPLRPSDLAYARQRRAFESARPLIFLNGCRTAGEIRGFTQMIGWASEFMGAGAGAFIGSLWAVRSAAARMFAAEFYRALVCDGEPLGVASQRARWAIAADEGDPTWLAYTVYGNPAASVMHAPLPIRSNP